jgi:hypothetical protein
MKIGMAMAALLLMAGVTHVAATERQHDIHRTVALLASMPTPCVSIQGSGARILLSRTDLIALDANHGQTYQTEAERLAMIAGNRAKSLLDAISSSRDASGCAEISFANGTDKQESMYLVGQLLEQGKAMVIRDGATQPELKIVVHDYNTPIMGTRSFEFVEGGAFLSYGTWVA